MSLPRSRFLPVGEHEVHVTEWGDPDLPPLVMWHGLARTGRDFDELALALSDQWRVICPDTIGRGLSSWAADAGAYRLPALERLAHGLLDACGLESVDWVGTSMGGLIGMRMESGDRPGRIRRMIVNDIGPEIPQAAIDRILSYAAELPVFATHAEAHDWLLGVYAPFGPSSEAFKARMTETSLRRRDDGRLTLHYDPRIVTMLRDRDEIVLWDRFARMETPLHLLRGATSDILPEALARRMGETGPRPEETVFPECGHAPSLSRAEDARLVRHLLQVLGDR